MIIKKNIINYTEYILLASLFVVGVVHYLGLLDMKMYFSGILFLIVCVYISFLWKENIVDERSEFIKSKTDRLLFLLLNAILSVYVLLGILIHFDYNNSLLLLAGITIAKIVISKYLENKN